jgi:acyl carrier protein
MKKVQEMQDRDALRETLYELILDVAPDLTRDDLLPDVDFRYDLGLDSIDLLNIANGIAERTGLEIPEVDRASLTNVDALLEYILEHIVTAKNRAFPASHSNEESGREE